MEYLWWHMLVSVVFIVLAFVWGRILRTEEGRNLRKDVREKDRALKNVRDVSRRAQQEARTAEYRLKHCLEDAEKRGREEALKEIAKGNQDTIELYFNLYDMAVKKYGDRHDEFLDFVLSWESRSFPAKQRQEWHGTDLHRR